MHYAIKTSQSSSSSLVSRSIPWMGEGLSMPSPNYPVLCFPRPGRVSPVFVQVVSSSLGWSNLVSSFLVVWSPSGDTGGPHVFEAVDVLCRGPLYFTHIAEYVYDVYPISDPDVGLSFLVRDVDHTSLHVGLCGRKFVLCLFGECPCMCNIRHS